MEAGSQTMAILLVFSAVGALDEIFYHTFKFNILSEKNCYRENVLHIFRGYLFFVICHLVAFTELSGIWAVFAMALLAGDLLLSVLDILEEPKSRKSLGGLPRGEYLLHMVLAFLLGIFYFVYLEQLFVNFGRASEFRIASGPYSVFQILVSLVGFVSLGISLRGSLSLRKVHN